MAVVTVEAMEAAVTEAPLAAVVTVAVVEAAKAAETSVEVQEAVRTAGLKVAVRLAALRVGVASVGAMAKAAREEEGWVVATEEVATEEGEAGAP